MPAHNMSSRIAARKAARLESQLKASSKSQRQGSSSGKKWLLALEAELQARLAEQRPAEEDTARVERCLQALSAVVEQLGNGWQVSPFGSAANGFATRGSDLDTTCHEVSAESQEEDGGAKPPQQPAVQTLKEQLVPLFRERSDFSVSEMVDCARVPILKLSFERCLEVDLSCHNTRPLQNTQLLSAYASIDPRVRDLGIAVKLWAKASGVCGAPDCHLSSYSWTLMVIYFLQVDPKVQLPLLPVQADEPSELAERVEAARAAWSSCTLCLAQLLTRFFCFYSQEFYWGSEVVSLRFGNRLDVRETLFEALKGRHHARLHVEDPFQLHRNLNCVLGEPQELELCAALQGALQQLQQGLLPECFQVAFQREVPSEAAEVSTQSTASSPGSSSWSTASSAADDRASCHSSGGDDPASFRDDTQVNWEYSCYMDCQELEAKMLASALEGQDAGFEAQMQEEQAEQAAAHQGPDWAQLLASGHVKAGSPVAAAPPTSENKKKKKKKMEKCFLAVQELEAKMMADAKHAEAAETSQWVPVADLLAHVLGKDNCHASQKQCLDHHELEAKILAAAAEDDNCNSNHWADEEAKRSWPQQLERTKKSIQSWAEDEAYCGSGPWQWREQRRAKATKYHWKQSWQ